MRLDRNPVFIDLDVGQSLISIPGTMTAVPLDKSNLSVEVIEAFFFFHGCLNLCF
jgi:polynucleotide 5'-kinase involved in rRNA processing